MGRRLWLVDATIIRGRRGGKIRGTSYSLVHANRRSDCASGVDDYVAQIQAAGQPLAATVKDRPEYGMREAAVRDPDGNDIYIGQEI